MNVTMNESTNVKQSKMHEINDHFQLPIYHVEHKTELSTNIITDLELIQTIDTSGNNPVYSYLFNSDPDDVVSQKLLQQTSKYITTDKPFLKDNQQLLKKHKSVESTNQVCNLKDVISIWNDIKLCSDFKEKYCFVEWEILEPCNKSALFLQVLSMFNLFSPILTLLMPIFILIIPFVILKLKGLPINLEEYITVLTFVAKQHAIGKLFTVNFREIHLQESVYMIISTAFYFFSVYQNIMVCVKFHQNMKTIHAQLHTLKEYLGKTIHAMDNYMSCAQFLSTHSEFNLQLMQKRDTLNRLFGKLQTITAYNLFNVQKIQEIGFVLKCFYELHTETEYENAIMYSFGFHGYLQCIEGLQHNIREKHVNFAKFIDNPKKSVFKNSVYACLKNKKPTLNTIVFNKNIIITGPNASGKTTVLKSTLINIIFTQQFGCGFYKSAKFAPFDFLHCYLNIPDTSGRDSLFQAEARRCKHILDCINANKTRNHFCAFDELYSGTNPDEAETSSTAFMRYLTKNNKVSCLLTTHFVKVCKNLNSDKRIVNYHMKTKLENSGLRYLYLLKEGISEVKGGLAILADMNYPEEILEQTRKNNRVKIIR
jgi:hypothetical protein